MSMMGELKFFLGLQVHQSPRGIFISQSQYAIELLKKHGLDECVSMSTPMATERLDADLQGTPTDQTTYHRMIGGLMYLSSVDQSSLCYFSFVHPDQARPYGPNTSKRSNGSSGCKDDCKSTSGGLQFLGGKLMSWSSKKQDCTAMSTAEAEYVSLSACFIIMAQGQQAVDVHPDELCPPNKRYDLMDANKKVDLENVQCPSESKILMNIITNHPLRFNIAASASVPWIYMAQFWHTLKEDGSKHRLKFLLDRKELTLTLDDFRRIFHLPQENDNNHASFMPPPSFSDMVPCWDLQWNSRLFLISRYLVFYSLGRRYLMWEGIYYSLHHPATSIPYPRFTKIIISHYMTIFPDISRCARDAYHNLQDDDIIRKKQEQVPSTEKADEMILQDMIQVSLAEHKSREEQEVRENVALVYEYLASEEIEKLVEDPENVDDSSPPRH
ncbi:hypothetical protein Tco_1354355 [Tanacetum coccineum]